jgi:hypothetical protein
MYALLPRITLHDFKWIEVGQTMTEGVSGIQFYEKNILYSAGDLPTVVPFQTQPAVRRKRSGAFAIFGSVGLVFKRNDCDYKIVLFHLCKI